MVKTELRLKLTPIIPLTNSSFKSYTTGWSGNTITTTTLEYPVPTLDNPTGTTTINKISGWDFSSTKYSMNGDQSAEPLIQLIDGSLIETGFTYNVTFTICNQPDTPLGGIRPYFMGIMGDEYTSNGTYTQGFTVNTIPAQPSLVFQPTGSFSGGIGGFLGPSVGGGGVVINSTNSYYATLDLYGDDNLNLNFSYFDNVANRASTYSKTLKLPSTQNNAKIFKHILSADVYVDLTQTDCVYMYKPIPCGLYYDSAQIMMGTFILTKVIKGNDSVIEYEGQFVSSTRSFADYLSDSLLTDNQPTINPMTGLEEIPDLDFSGYDHTFSLQNMFLTHATTGSYKLSGADLYSSYSGSTGVFYPFMDLQGEDSTNYLYLNNIKPALYIKEIWDKIFKRTGYQYESTFLNGSVFKSLILPHLSNYQLDPESIYNLTFNVGRTARDLFGYNGYRTGGWVSVGNGDGSSTWVEKVASFNDDTPPLFYINNNSWSKTLFKMTIPTGKGGLYTFTGNAVCSVYDLEGYDDGSNGGNEVGTKYNAGNDGVVTADAIQFKMSLWVKRGSTWTEFETLEGSMEIPTHDDGSVIQGGVGSLVDEFGNLVYCNLNKTFSPVSLGDNNEAQIRLSIKNENRFWWKLGSSPRVPCSSSRAWGAFENSSTFLCEYSVDGCYHTGARVFTKYILPKDYKQIDFVKNISNMFSLVWSNHPTLKDTFVIEPWNNFFNTGQTSAFDNVSDWTSKMDLSREIDYERIDFLIDKSQQLFYKSDNRDYQINDYNETYKYPFGSRYIPNPVFEIDQNKVEVGFIPALIHKFGSTNWLMSQIFNKQDRDTNLKENKHFWPSDFQPKVLTRKIITNLGIGGGALSTLNIRMPVEGLVSGSTQNQYPDGIYSFGPSPALRNYHPYAGIIDDPYIPTYTLEFGPAKRYAHTNPRPNVDLYSKYWMKKINLFMNPNSKKITAYFRLNYKDISNIDFRKLILVDNAYYILYKIIEWNPESYSKVELLKISTFDINSIVLPAPANLKSGGAQIKPVVQDTRVINLEATEPNYYPTKFNVSGYTTLPVTDNSFSRSASGIIIGKNNQISGNSFLISANGNIVRDDRAVILNSTSNSVTGSDVTIIGSNQNNVNANFVTIIGSNQNTVYIDNTFIMGGGNVNLDPPPSYSGETVLTGTTSGSTTGSTNIDLPNIFINSNWINVPSGYTNGGNVYINSSGTTVTDSGQTYINNRNVDTLTDVTYVAGNYFNKADDIKMASGKTITVEDSGYLYIGNSTSDGSWRVSIGPSNVLRFESRKSGGWRTEQDIPYSP